MDESSTTPSLQDWVRRRKILSTIFDVECLIFFSLAIVLASRVYTHPEPASRGKLEVILVVLSIPVALLNMFWLAVRLSKWLPADKITMGPTGFLHMPLKLRLVLMSAPIVGGIILAGLVELVSVIRYHR